ncbi:unnamed protein product [Aphanomyces euteiches]|uniref:Uncharacterized protein n=1 Tax=Aphanomyces euteiches TaxID=100861 RepID=A0A6G0WV35_9STRA|nr:hypothetical protein Ae201684_011296 [Aphanomyces euteiches]KAH9100493.1 hypothetical protein Ae201684P_006690 [Aphanomyces euteiches]KAH9144128.1 hypothetical protein AeRB84_011901 [Aphanomyces euteiches]
MPKVPRLTVSTTQESAALSIPHDILVKIVYFVQEWSSVASLLEALRPAKVLGPLEHMWHLHFVLKWHGEDLWPRLDLTKLDTDSCTHLEGIVKYHAQVAVNSKTIVAAAPPSLRTLNILTDSICMKELQKLAQERQIQLNAKD